MQGRLFTDGALQLEDHQRQAVDIENHIRDALDLPLNLQLVHHPVEVTVAITASTVCHQRFHLTLFRQAL